MIFRVHGFLSILEWAIISMGGSLSLWWTKPLAIIYWFLTTNVGTIVKGCMYLCWLLVWTWWKSNWHSYEPSSPIVCTHFGAEHQFGALCRVSSYSISNLQNAFSGNQTSAKGLISSLPSSAWFLVLEKQWSWCNVGLHLVLAMLHLRLLEQMY